MTGSVTFAATDTGPGLAEYRFDWRSDASGDAKHVIHGPFWGYWYTLVTLPGSGDSAPTLNYDVTVKDEDGFDLLRGAGANRSDTTDQETALQTGAKEPYVVYARELHFAVAGAGATNTGMVIIYLMRYRKYG